MTSRSIPGYLSADDTIDSGFYTEWFKTVLMTVDGIIVSFTLLPRWPYHPLRNRHRMNARLLLDCQNNWDFDGDVYRDDELVEKPSLIVAPRSEVAELIFCDVSDVRVSCAIGHRIGYPKVDMRSDDGARTWVFDTEGLFVQSRSIYLRRVPRPIPSGLSPDTFIPVDDAIPATPVDASQRMCERCHETWESPPGERFAYCPICGELTALATDKPE